MIRWFIAVSFPDVFGRSLAALCAGVPGARWANPDQFHLTLRFVGEVDGRIARAVYEELDGITMPAFDLNLFGVGTFGDRRKVHTLWAGVRPSPGTAACRKRPTMPWRTEAGRGGKEWDST